MDKTGYLQIEVVSGDDESCLFHRSLRDTNNKRIYDLEVLRVSFGYTKHSTHSFVICRECWEKLKTEMGKLI